MIKFPTALVFPIAKIKPSLRNYESNADGFATLIYEVLYYTVSMQVRGGNNIFLSGNPVL